MSIPMLGVITAAGIILGMLAVLVLTLLAWQVRQETSLQQRVLGADALDSEFMTISPVLQIFGRMGKRIELWLDASGETQKLLVQTGRRSVEQRLAFYVIRTVAVGVAAVVVFVIVVGGAGRISGYLLPLYSFSALAFAALIPNWILRSAAQKRKAKIEREVPLYIHLLILLFDAGLSIRQAFATMVREGAGVLPELGFEMERVLRQLDAGAETGAVLKSLGEVLEVDNLISVFSVLRQVDRYGGETRTPLLETLKVIEERRSLTLRERVNLTSGRMTVVMVVFFFPALLIFIAGPAVFAILTTMASVGGK